MGIQCLDGFNRSYKCDQCGAEAVIWGPSWSWFGSYALMDVAPEHLAVTCSPVCEAAFSARMKAGEVEVPSVKMRAPNGFVIKGKRRGY